MNFLVKITCSELLSKRDVIRQLKDGLLYIAGSSHPEDRIYANELRKVKVTLANKKILRGES